jgi:hypothetical protein
MTDPSFFGESREFLWMPWSESALAGGWDDMITALKEEGSNAERKEETVPKPLYDWYQWWRDVMTV